MTSIARFHAKLRTAITCSVCTGFAKRLHGRRSSALFHTICDGSCNHRFDLRCLVIAREPAFREPPRVAARPLESSRQARQAL
jgi:hypothetical protein